MRRTLIRVASIALLLLAWETAARAGLMSSYHLPALSAVLRRLAEYAASGKLATDVALTLWRTLAGFALAALCGVALGVSVARTALMKWFFDPLISFGLPLPKIAFLPIFVLWFGVYDQSKVLMIAFSAVFPIIVATSAGTESVEKILLWSARSLGTKPRQLLWEIVLPAALPQVFTGLQIGLPIALIVAIVCEMTLGGLGLGASMVYSMRFMDSTGVFADLVAITVLGSILIKTMEIIRRRLLAWHQETAHA
jgi:ABC-type nitrate/sulfonate/bicarbonate transport system permease component